MEYHHNQPQPLQKLLSTSPNHRRQYQEPPQALSSNSRGLCRHPSHRRALLGQRGPILRWPPNCSSWRVVRPRLSRSRYHFKRQRPKRREWKSQLCCHRQRIRSGCPKFYSWIWRIIKEITSLPTKSLFPQPCWTWQRNWVQSASPIRSTRSHAITAAPQICPSG